MTSLEQSEVSAGGRARWHYLAVGLVAAVVVLWGLGGAVMDDHECHMALTAREMADPDPRPWLLEASLDGKAYEVPPKTWYNQWLVPVENGKPRLVKTPLPYWCAAGVARAWAAMGLPEPRVNNLTARLPSALAAILLSLLVLHLGRRMLPPRAALYAGLMLAVSAGLASWGRNARPEMLLCLLTTAAMACFYHGATSATRGGRVGWMLFFWVVMGLANLAKEFVPLLLLWPLAAWLCWRESDAREGDERAMALLRRFLLATLIGLAIHVTASMVPALRWWRGLGLPDEKGAYVSMALAFGVPALWYLVACRGWRPIAGLVPTAVPGAILMLALFVPWMLYMAHLMPGLASGIFSAQVTERASGGAKWTVDSPVKYFSALLLYTLPWTAFVPGAFIAPLLKRFAAHRRALAFLLLWCAGIFFLFVASAGKREHYIFPLLPPTCLLMGFIAHDVLHGHAWIKPALARVLCWGYAIVGLLAVPGLLIAGRVMKDQPGLVWMAIPAAVAAALLVAGTWRARKERFGAFLPLATAAMATVLLGYVTLDAAFDERAAIRDFARAAARIVEQQRPPGQDLPAVYHAGDPQAKTAFYFGRTLPSYFWPFDRLRISVGREEAYRQMAQWLENPAHAPWIIGYEGTYDRKTRRVTRFPVAVELERLGYEPVLKAQDKTKARFVFALYQRQHAPRPASGPATPTEAAPAAEDP